MKVIGIAGTAKNTGKTTTLTQAIAFFAGESKQLFITGIGFDGEDFDNLTGLPKPRIFVPEGAIVASTLPLLRSSSAQFEDLTDTMARSALGRIFTGKVTLPGRVVLAGPGSLKDLASVTAFAPRNSIVLLDGAFSRIAPMIAAHSLILATGAARNKDPFIIAREINVMDAIFGLPLMRGEPASEAGLSSGQLIYISGGLFLPGQSHELAWRLRGIKGPGIVRLRGIINPRIFLEALNSSGFHQKGPEENRALVSFVFDHPIMLLLSGDLLDWEKVFAFFHPEGLNFQVRKSTTLLGVTVNPYRPLKMPTGKYAASYIPPENYLKDIAGLTKVPCTDIILEGPDKLGWWLKRFLE